MDGYYKKRSQYSDISGSLQISALLSGTVTLAVPVGDAVHAAFHTIFIQRIYGSVSGPLVAQTWKLGDNADAPVTIYTLPTDVVSDTTPGPNTNFQSEWGSAGIGLTVGKNFQLVISSGGAAGTISWEGYCKRTVSGIP